MSILSDIAEDDADLEMTPMIDVTFLLLIFFMCTIKFKTLEGKLNAYLPKDRGSNQSQNIEKPEKVDIVITVVEQGTKMDRAGKESWDPTSGVRFIFKPGSRVVQYQVGPRRYTDLGQLRARLISLHEADDERPATIDPRPGTVYGDVIGVLDAAIQAGFKEITFAGSYE